MSDSLSSIVKEGEIVVEGVPRRDPECTQECHVRLNPFPRRRSPISVEGGSVVEPKVAKSGRKGSDPKQRIRDTMTVRSGVFRNNVLGQDT